MSKRKPKLDVDNALAKHWRNKKPRGERTPLHPIFKTIVGSMILASAHPKGMVEGMRDVAFIEIMRKAYTWLNEVPGRSVHLRNNGEDIDIIFTETSGINCVKPFE